MARTISQEANQLLEALGQSIGRGRGTEVVSQNIRVSSVTRGMGFIYEKIRNALDYHEEHLWAKNAILRVLRRRFYEILAGKKIGRALLEELIRGHYLENDAVPEDLAFEVDKILEKYERVFLALGEKYRGEEEERLLRELEYWLLSLAAAEVEELLHQSHNDRAFIVFFYKTMKRKLKIDPSLRLTDLDLELYLASYRNLLLADRDMESYTLFRLYWSEWENPREDFIANLVEDLPNIKAKIETVLRQPIRKDLDLIFKKRSLLVLLLRDIVAEDPGSGRQAIEDPEKLEDALRHHYEMRYRANRARLQRSAIRAVVFIFITKMLLAILAEVPYEIIKTGNINLIALGINTLLPPTLLLSAALAIKMPGEEQNFLQLVIDFEKMLNGSEEQPIIDVLRQKKRRALFSQALLVILYVINFGVTFWILAAIFKILHFDWLSASLFIFFLSLVSFFALRLRKTANELAAIEDKENILRTTFDFLIFPIVEIGRLLFLGLRSINVLALVFDFLIEAPFKTMVEILEEWFTFLRERKQAL